MLQNKQGAGDTLIAVATVWISEQREYLRLHYEVALYIPNGPENWTKPTEY